LRRALELSKRIYEHLRSKGVEVSLESKLASFLGAKPTRLRDMDVDVVITVGGDGTILRTNVYLPKPTPILGVNLGFRAFLGSVSPEEALDAVDHLIEGAYTLEGRISISADVNGVPQPDALNEVLVCSRTRSKIIHFTLRKDGRDMVTCSADGIIIATPTGSTAYSLSAGGPVLDPTVDGLVITPLCSLPPIPPIVVPSETLIQVELLGPGEAVLVIDGCYTRNLKREDVVSLKRSEREALFVRIRERDFYGEFRRRILFFKEFKP